MLHTDSSSGSPVHVDEKQVIPTDEVQADPSSTERHQHHLRTKEPHRAVNVPPPQAETLVRGQLKHGASHLCSSLH